MQAAASVCGGGTRRGAPQAAHLVAGFLLLLPASCTAFCPQLPALRSTHSSSAWRSGRALSAPAPYYGHGGGPLTTNLAPKLTRQSSARVNRGEVEDGAAEAEAEEQQDYIERLNTDLGPMHRFPAGEDIFDEEAAVKNAPRHGTSSLLCIATVPLPSGKTAICTGGFDDYVRVWEFSAPDVIEPIDGVSPQQPPNVAEVCKLGGHVGPVFSLEHLGGGRVSSGGGTDRAARIWDLSSAEGGAGDAVVELPGHTGWVRSLACDKGGEHVYSIGCNFIKVWDAARGRHLGDLRVEGDQLKVVYGGGFLFSAGIDGSIRAWKAPHGVPQGAPDRVEAEAHGGRITGLVWRDGFLYSSSHDGLVRMWTGWEGRDEGSEVTLEPTQTMAKPPSRRDEKAQSRLQGVR